MLPPNAGPGASQVCSWAALPAPKCARSVMCADVRTDPGCADLRGVECRCRAGLLMWQAGTGRCLVRCRVLSSERACERAQGPPPGAPPGAPASQRAARAARRQARRVARAGRNGWPTSSVLPAAPESEADQATLVDTLQDWKTTHYQELLGAAARPAWPCRGGAAGPPGPPGGAGGSARRVLASGARAGPVGKCRIGDLTVCAVVLRRRSLWRAWCGRSRYTGRRMFGLRSVWQPAAGAPVGRGERARSQHMTCTFPLQ